MNASLSDVLKLLRKHRREWRYQANLLNKNYQQHKNLRDWYEMNIYTACANNIDKDIKNIEKTLKNNQT